MSCVTLSLAKAQMNIDHSADDELIQLHIDAAEAWFENQTGRKLADLSPVQMCIRDRFEISVVRNPAHPKARITNAKDATAAIAEAINRAAVALNP